MISMPKQMDWLNYHHFFYFWLVAREGSLSRAGEQLRLSHPTLSAQIKRLEDTLGVKLFARKGRGLVLTDVGQVAFRYASQIFPVGQEFLDVINGREPNRPARLVVGVADVLPKSVVHLLLKPAFHLDHEVQVICREDGSVDDFLAELAIHTVDVVLADAPMSPGPVRAFNHLLGECGTTFFANKRLASVLKKNKFPQSLDNFAMLLPGEKSALRRHLDHWFQAEGIRPKVVAEIDDSGLAKVFAEEGLGVFAAPNIVAREIQTRFKVEAIAHVPSIRNQFYAISVERNLKHSAVVAICDSARKELLKFKRSRIRRGK